MGCWSESCAVSGVEIRNGAQIYAMTWQQIYGDEYMISVPPVVGTYDDYGGIDLTEDLPEFGFKKGENWRLAEDERGEHMLVDAAVFDFLSSLEPEFTYGDRPKTIGEMWERHRAELVTVLEQWIAIRDGDGDEMKKAVSMLRSEGRTVFGYSDGVMKGAPIVFQEAVEAGGSIESLTPLIEAYGRAMVICRAMIELRKKPTFGTSNGPQHGGEQALIPFYTFTLMLARKRRDDDRDDYWDWEEMDKDHPLDSWKAEVATGATKMGFREWQTEQELNPDGASA